MDPNSNLTPGVDPTVPAPSPAPEPPLASEPILNPAVDIANAALSGAEPIVVATPEEPEGPVNLAPSADFNMPEVATVSATPNGTDPNLALNNDPLNPANDPLNPGLDSVSEIGTPAPEQAPSESSENMETNPEENSGETPENAEIRPEDTEPIVAAAPVPGSIGSAKSYADIQREEAEKAAKVAAAQNKKFKFSKNTILIIVIAVVAVIGLGVGAFLIFGGSDSTPTPTVTATEPYDEEPAISTLSCKRTLAPDEYVSFGAINGTWENVFYFADDVLDGLETNINYSYANAVDANQWRAFFESQYGATTTTTETESTTETTEPATDSETTGETSGAKSVTEMLKHSVTSSGLIVTHKMEVKSEDINDWVTSDAYSDVTYGAEENASEDTERNLDYYKGLQNAINYTCTVSK